MILKVIYQDADYVAVDKPSGLLVHRTALDRHATEFALQIIKQQLGLEVFPCHRIDRPTSGILLFALNKDALRHAREQFDAKRVIKEYRAIVRGWTTENGVIDYPLRSEDKPEKVQNALTEYTRIATSELPIPLGRYGTARFSLLKLKPITGRTHQIRRHLAHIRHPILGDTRHGDGTQNNFLRQYCGLQKLLLRAHRLKFQAYESKALISLTAPSEPEFEGICNRLQLTYKSN